MFKKKRSKRPPTKKKHRKHHPNSKETEPNSIPWHVLAKEVNSRLTPEERLFTDEEALYCCWEEDWTIEETICECKDAFEMKEKLRKY